jgi:MSHA pilin protein MshA
LRKEESIEALQVAAAARRKHAVTQTSGKPNFAVLCRIAYLSPQANLGDVVMRRPAQGFTLIELIVVISIVGILASVALPRFMNAQRDARIAKVFALNGSIRSAAALAHARCLLDQAANPAGTCTSAGGTAAMEGVNIPMINGYPQANLNGIITAAQLAAVTDALTISAGGAGANQLITIDMIGATDQTNCRISYTSPTAAGDAAVIAPPLTAGC